MENCVIYSHYNDVEKLTKTIASALPKAKVEVNANGEVSQITATIKGGLFSKSKVLRVNYRQRLNPSYILDKIECGLTQNLAGMSNYISGMPTSNESVKQQLIIKVQSANCEIAVLSDHGLKPYRDVIHQIVTSTKGFIFTPPNSLFAKSNGQMFLDESFNIIAAQDGQCEVDAVDVTVDAKYADQAKSPTSADQQRRKDHSNKSLESKGVKVNYNLPCVVDSAQVSLRSKEEVIDRMYALLAVAAKGEGIEQPHLDGLIKDKAINSFSPKEQSIIEAPTLDDQTKVIATWRYESLYVLEWMLGLEAQLKYPDEICDVPKMVKNVIGLSREELTAAVSLKSADEVLDVLDEIYRMHWAVVDARINQQEVGGGLQPGVVYERHYALNWLINDLDCAWDDVQTNT